MTLTDKERAVLDLERSWWVGSDAPATKGEAIAMLGLSRAQYYALRDSARPMGVAEYQLIEALPAELQTSLPSIEQIERELGNSDTSMEDDAQ